MKLSKIILENNKIIERAELNLSDKDVLKLAEKISDKLEEYLDTGNKTLIHQVVASAIGDLLQNNEV